MPNYILAVDEGTTSTRAMLFSTTGEAVAQHQLTLEQYYPEDGWVTHDAEEIWSKTLLACRETIKSANIAPQDILAIGITNQRETSVAWHKGTDRVLHPAIVWQDRRTSHLCETLKAQGHESTVQAATGLLLDPYFSATKFRWLLDEVPAVQEALAAEQLALGTIDSFLLWRFTKGRQHATDATNASRTALFNIHQNAWDDELLDLFGVPKKALPEVFDSNAHFGEADPEWFGHPIPILCMMGDQQAATVGQVCFEPGHVKCTYGTGGFAMLNTGQKPVPSTHRLLTTIAYRFNGETTYGLEGSIFNAGTIVQWLRDKICLVKDASETEGLAAESLHEDLYFVPAFTGLGAPHWDPHARAGYIGIQRYTNRSDMVRAALDSICFQTADLMQAMCHDYDRPIARLRVDGGMVKNQWLMQRISDLLALPLEWPKVTETTALGVAYVAGLQKGVFDSLDAIAEQWHSDKLVHPEMFESKRQELLKGWHEAVGRVLTT